MNDCLTMELLFFIWFIKKSYGGREEGGFVEWRVGADH